MPATTIGTLEAQYSLHDNAQYNAVVLHPHPLYEGTMNNKVVYSLYKTLSEQGNVVRFNFRGVGQSAGEYDNGVGETQDALQIIDWFEQELPLIVVGFSFGAWIASKVADKADKCVLVSPPANLFKFPALKCPNTMVLHGTEDEIVPFKEWTDCQKFIAVQAADHFYKDHLTVLNDHVKQFVTIGNH